MRKIFGFIESGMLLLVGTFGLWLSLSDAYLLLMNDKFRWLTFTGALLLVLLGAVSIARPSKQSFHNTFFFVLLLLIVLLGKPYLPNANSINPSERFMQAGMWDQIDLEKFPKMELRNLSTSEDDKVFESGSSFTTVGVVKRLDDLNGHNSFAFMSTFMYCCVADMFGTGFRVPTEQLENLEDGQMVMITGKLAKEDTEIALPNFRFGMAMISSVNKNYYLQADEIMTFNRIDQLPRLKEILLQGEKIQLFAKALKESGLLDDLEKDGFYTLFVPVDKALENMEPSIEKMSPRKLKKFLKAHISKGKILSRDLSKQEKLKALNGKTLHIDHSNGKLKINQSRVLFKDTEAQNGIIHYVYPEIIKP